LEIWPIESWINDLKKISRNEAIKEDFFFVVVKLSDVELMKKILVIGF
jgi:hypothetical protein